MTLAASGIAVGQYIPPDRYGDEHRGTCMLRKNMGQVFDNNGQSRQDVKALFESAPLDIYLRDSSRVSYAFHVLHHDSITPDTAYRVDMTIAKGKIKSPSLVLPAPGVKNFYQGASAVEQVPAYRRGIYKKVYNDIDAHFYGSSSGPRMSFVVLPGGDPADIRLEFTGQDSLGLDLLGTLRAYLGGKWVEFREAIAYQVDNNGNLYDVAWTPSWAHTNGTMHVGFNFGTYNQNYPLVLRIGYVAMGGGGVPDPRNLAWSTFIGGTGGDELTDVKTDDQGDAYACGATWSSEFPLYLGISNFDPFLGEASGSVNAVVMKFDKLTKHLEWGTYYGGSEEVSPISVNYACTDARKLAVPPSGSGVKAYVYTTGTTNCSDFEIHRNPQTVFSNALYQAYTTGYHRMWVGAFKKDNGTRDWATTHGLLDDAYGEEGLAIAFDTQYGLAVGGRVNQNGYTPTTLSYPCVTPVGAYQQTEGGGFVMHFNPDFTIRWSTAFGGYDENIRRTQVTDLCFTRNMGSTQLWLCGASWGPGFQYEPPANPTFGTALIASFDIPSLALEYANLWGGSGTSVAYGLDFDGKDIWVVGGTESHDLTTVDCPPPASTAGVHHTYVNGGPDQNFRRCDGFILALNPITFSLEYGTLMGGEYYDMLLDVCHDGEQIYITGESRSTGVFATNDLDPDLYYQPLNPNVNRRDAILLALDKTAQAPVVRWNTAFGGTESERPWSVAVSENELFVVGATSSEQWDGFPLQDFDPSSLEDFYQDFNMGGDGWVGFLEYYDFEISLNYLTGFFGEAWSEPLTQNYDGFIASFNLDYHVGVQDAVNNTGQLPVATLPVPGQWMITLPTTGSWRLEAFNSKGQLVQTWHTSTSSQLLDMSTKATGLYVVKATQPNGKVYYTKLVRP